MRLVLALSTLAMFTVCGGPSEDSKVVSRSARGNQTGIAECDAVLESYAPCIDEHAPKLVRDDIKAGMERSFSYWFELIEKQPEDRNELVRPLCVRALEKWKRTAAAWGCEAPRDP